ADDRTRETLAWLLGRVDESRTLDARAENILKAAPLIPDPSGDFASAAAFETELEQSRPVYFATERYVKGSYPEPCALLTHEHVRHDRLLPHRNRQDVVEIVRRRQRAAENRAQWEAQIE